MEIVEPVLIEKTIKNHLEKNILQIESCKNRGQKINRGHYEIIGRCYRLLKDQKYIHYFELCISAIESITYQKTDRIYEELGNFYRILGGKGMAQENFKLAFETRYNHFEKYSADHSTKPNYIVVAPLIESAVLANRDELAVNWLDIFPSLTRSTGLRVYPIGNYSKARMNQDPGLLIKSINEISVMVTKYKNQGSVISTGQVNLMDWFEIGKSILDDL